jgi:hypothetical protein
MAYVEEITLDEAMQSYPEHPLFTVLDNWNPPTDFGTEDKISPPGIPRGYRATHPAEEFTTCYVEEEVSSCAKEKNDPPTGAPLEEATQPNNRQVHQASEANEGEGAQGPFPLASVEGNWQDQHPFTNPGYLALIFEMRSMLDDQIFRIAQIDHRLDMLYAAHSRTLPKRQCPTCAQAYAFPAGWRRHGEEDEPDWIKGLVMFIVSNLFLFQNKVLAQLDHSHVVIRLLEYRLNLMERRPGFLRAGQHSDNFVCLNTSGIECPAVSVSCSGGTTGITNRLCNSATLI